MTRPRGIPATIALFLVGLSFSVAARGAEVPPIEFMSGDAAKAAIVDDSLDPYFTRMCAHEMSLKTDKPITGDTPADRVNECKMRYQSAVLEFTDDEKADVHWAVDVVQEGLVKDFPVFGKTPFSFIKVDKSLEGGMPHTRGGHIVISDAVLQYLKGARTSGDRRRVAGLLVHEQTHVVERLHPDLFVPLFTDVFHFVHAKHVKTDQWLDDRQLINPDGTVCDWVMPVVEKPGADPTYILPLIACGSVESTDMTADLTTIAVTLVPDGDGYKPKESDDGKPVIRRLSAVKGYFKDIGHVSDDYHPNEIAADWMADLAVATELDDRSKKIPAEISDWAHKAFSEPVAR